MIDEVFVKQTLGFIGLVFLVVIWGLCELLCWVKYRKR